MSNQTVIVYSGDETANVLTEKQVNQALEAMIAARPFVFPTIGYQMDRVRDFANEVEKSKAIIAALICAESCLRSTGGTMGLPPHEGLRKALGACGYRLVERGDRQFWLAMDIYVIAVADDLNNYRFPDFLEGKIKSIEEIRFFDKNAITYICSTEGSYWTQFVNMRVRLKDEFSDDDDLREKACDWVDEVNREMDAGRYLDERMVDRILELNASGTVHHYGNPGISWEDALDEAQNTAGHAIRSIRKHQNYWLKEKKKPLLPVDEATIGKLVDERFADPAQANEEMERYIFDQVREGLQANWVL